jgi:hypothetical protein
MPGAFFFGLSLTVFSSSSSEISLSLSSFHLISVSLGVLLSGVSVSGSSTGKYFRMRAIAVSPGSGPVSLAVLNGSPDRPLPSPF